MIDVLGVIVLGLICLSLIGYGRRASPARTRVARFHSFSALLLPLLLQPAAAPASYKYAKPPQAAPDRFSTHPKSTPKSASPQAAAILPRPEGALSLVDPAHPALLLINQTGLEAKGIDYAIALWNAETLEEMLAMEGHGPGALLPREMFGPLDLIDPGKIGAFPKDGDKLVGNIAVNCQTCARGYSYWVYIDWGKSGWFSEIEGIADGDLVARKGIGGMPAGISPRLSRAKLLKKTLVAWVAIVEQEARIPIAPSPLPKGMRVVSPE